MLIAPSASNGVTIAVITSPSIVGSLRAAVAVGQENLVADSPDAHHAAADRAALTGARGAADRRRLAGRRHGAGEPLRHGLADRVAHPETGQRRRMRVVGGNGEPDDA